MKHYESNYTVTRNAMISYFRFTVFDELYSEKTDKKLTVFDLNLICLETCLQRSKCLLLLSQCMRICRSCVLRVYRAISNLFC